jgi:hypothetical protein
MDFRGQICGTSQNQVSFLQFDSFEPKLSNCKNDTEVAGAGSRPDVTDS